MQSSASAPPLNNEPAPPIEPIHNPNPTDVQVFTRLQELGVVFDGDIHTAYLSDMSDLEDNLFKGEDDNHEMSCDEDGKYGEDTFTEPKEAARQKCRRLSVSIAQQRKAEREKWHNEEKSALADIKKLIDLKHTEFQGGPNGLQAVRAGTIHSLLMMVVTRERNWMYASEVAAESHGFKCEWGSRLVRKWTREWIESRHEETIQKPGQFSLTQVSEMKFGHTFDRKNGRWIPKNLQNSLPTPLYLRGKEVCSKPGRK